jgi:hypothetical protein
MAAFDSSIAFLSEANGLTGARPPVLGAELVSPQPDRTNEADEIKIAGIKAVRNNFEIDSVRMARQPPAKNWPSTPAACVQTAKRPVQFQNIIGEPTSCKHWLAVI